MKCDKCGKDNANVRYLRNINGVKQEMNLCEECSKKLGITDVGFSMPINFSSFLGGFLDEFENQDLFSLIEPKAKVKCDGCDYTFEDILNTGKFGCPKCYETFEAEIDNLMNKLHGSNRHIGRLNKAEKLKVENDVTKLNNKNTNTKTEKENSLEQLQQKLQKLVEEEKYEEAAIIRDKIKEVKEGK